MGKGNFKQCIHCGNLKFSHDEFSGTIDQVIKGFRISLVECLSYHGFEIEKLVEEQEIEE